MLMVAGSIAKKSLMNVARKCDEEVRSELRHVVAKNIAGRRIQQSAHS